MLQAKSNVNIGIIARLFGQYSMLANPEPCYLFLGFSEQHSVVSGSEH